MSLQFQIQKKHEIDWDDKSYFNSDNLNSVIRFLRKYDDGFQVQRDDASASYNPKDCRSYIIDADLIDTILKKIDKGSIKKSNFPDDVDREELIRFLNDCLMHSKNTGGIVYIDVV